MNRFGRSRRRDIPRRRSRTREEWIASLRWNINDAKEALRNAVDLGDWNAVEKYTRQIKTMEPRLFRAESGQLGIRRAGRQRMIREEEGRRAKVRYEERVREVAQILRGQGYSRNVRDRADNLIGYHGYPEALRKARSMRPREGE
jgi:hypothetical protein